MADRVRNITGLELAQLIRAGASDVKVVDVRDIDRAGGHIKGSINIHAADFLEDTERYASEWSAGTRIVFHCMYSQVRGPECARALARANKALKLENPPVPYILVGGFRGMAAQGQFKDVLEGFTEM